MEEAEEKPLSSQAHIPRVIKHEMAQELYNCECGKSYLTFAALYLHAKFKHSIKLSNRKTDGNFKVEEKNDKTIYTYYLKQLSTSQDNQNNNDFLNLRESSKDLEPVNYDISNSEKVRGFLAYLASQQTPLQPPFTTYQIILLAFRDYLEELESIDAEEATENVPKDMGLLFNEFVLYYIPVMKKNTSLTSFKKEVITKILLHFGKWLKSMRYTEYTIVEAPQEKSTFKGGLQK